MIAKDESLFVMDALNQVCRRRRLEKLLSHSHDVTGRLATSFSNTEGLDTYLYCHSLTKILLFLVAVSHHIQTICVSMTIAQCQAYLFWQILPMHFNDLLV